MHLNRDTENCNPKTFCSGGSSMYQALREDWSVIGKRTKFRPLSLCTMLGSLWYLLTRTRTRSSPFRLDRLNSHLYNYSRTISITFVVLSDSVPWRNILALDINYLQHHGYRSNFKPSQCTRSSASAHSTKALANLDACQKSSRQQKKCNLILNNDTIPELDKMKKKPPN